MKQPKVIAVAAGLILVVSACSSSKKTGSAPPTSAAALSGTPVEAVSIIDMGTSAGPDYQAGISIGEAAVNAAGGIKGHPLHITVCTDLSDPNQAAACARDAVSNSAVLADIGTNTTYGAQIDPILTAGGLASVGNSVDSSPDFTCNVCFNDSPGIFTSIGSAVIAVQQLNAKRIGIPYIDIPAGATLAPTVDGLVKPLGGQSVGVVPVAVTAADLTPQAAAEGAAKPDAIIDGLTESLFTKFIHAYRAQGFQTPIIVSGAVYDEQQVQSALSGVTDNLYIDTDMDHSSHGYQTFLADKAKYDPSYAHHNDGVLRAYFAVKEFAYAANHANSLSRADLLAEMNSLSGYTSDGLQPPLDYTQPQTGLGGKAPRVISDTLWLLKYDNGKFVPVGSGKGINAFTGASS